MRTLLLACILASAVLSAGTCSDEPSSGGESETDIAVQVDGDQSGGDEPVDLTEDAPDTTDEPEAADAGGAELTCDNLLEEFARFEASNGVCSDSSQCVMAWEIGTCDCAPAFGDCAVALDRGFDSRRWAEFADVVSTCTGPEWEFNFPHVCDCGPPCTARCVAGMCTASCGSCME